MLHWKLKMEWHESHSGFTKLHMGLIGGPTRQLFLVKKKYLDTTRNKCLWVVLVKNMSVLIDFLLQNTNLVSVLIKICPNFAAVISDRTDTFRKLCPLKNMVELGCFILIVTKSKHFLLHGTGGNCCVTCVKNPLIRASREPGDCDDKWDIPRDIQSCLVC